MSDYDPLVDPDMNPGIRRTVAALRDAGFETTDSGDGETSKYGCDRDYPYVVCVVDPRQAVYEADRMYRFLSIERYVKFNPAEGKTIEVSYSPIDGVAIVTLVGIKDGDFP